MVDILFKTFKLFLNNNKFPTIPERIEILSFAHENK